MVDRKLFAGAKIRRFRNGLGVTQSRMAADLGVSPSYLNLIERDQRPVSARVLLRLAEAYDLDLRALAAQTDAELVGRLAEAIRDPALTGFQLDRRDLEELAERQPRLAEAFARLHGAYLDAQADAAGLADRLETTGVWPSAAADRPVEEVREALQARDNHFPELEDSAARLAGSLDLVDGAIYAALSRGLRERHGVATRILPYDVMDGALRRYDRHSRSLQLSELLEPSSRIFQIAYQFALFEAGGLLDRIVANAPLSSAQAERLYRISLANYFAAAVMMPYTRFHDAATALRYDVHVLARRFSASFEQVCHRLTTLRRPGARGVGFFMLRIDPAGNVTKRFGGRIFPFARAGGACPRWSIHRAVRDPDRIIAERVALSDGTGFFTIAKAVRRPRTRPGDDPGYAVVALGCADDDAGRLIYADAPTADGAATPIGVTCRLCERVDCSHRAHPPLRRPLLLDEHRRGPTPFAFRSD